MKRTRRTWIRTTLGVMLIMTIFLYYMTSKNSMGNVTSLMISMVVNFVFFFAICYFCYRWKKIFFTPIVAIMDDLDYFKTFIEKSKDDEYESTLEYVKENYETCFKTEYIKECFSKYIDELENLDVESAEEYYSCDVSDFINFEEICINVKRNTADSIASAMTGLGILGTFVGLAIGLQSFDASNANAMAESIVPLIDGIKTAFYTSIYGVVISLILNYQFKTRLNELGVSLNEFYDCYHKTVLAYPEYIHEKQSFDLQAEQKEIMSSFSETVSVALSREMSNLMDPIFEKFSNSIENFSNTMAINQVEGLERIVDNFVVNMNASLGNQLEELGSTIKDVCEWQAKSVESMDAIIKNAVDEADKIQNLNDRLTATISKFDEYLDKLAYQENDMIVRMENYKNTVDTTFDSLKKVCDRIETLIESEDRLKDANVQTSKILKENGELLVHAQDKLSESSQTIVNSQELIKHNIDLFTDNVKESINKLIEYADEKFNNVKDILQNIDSEIGGSAKSFADVYNKLQEDIDGSLERTFKLFDKELANMTTYFSGAIVGMNENTEKMPAILAESCAQLKKQTDSYIEIIAGMESEIKHAITNIAKLNSNINTAIVDNEEAGEN